MITTERAEKSIAMQQDVVRSTALNPTLKNFLYIKLLIYRLSQEEWTKLRESVPYVKIYRYNPKHLYPKWNGKGDNGQRILKL